MAPPQSVLRSAPVRPRSVDLAFSVHLCGSVLGLLSALLGLVILDEQIRADLGSDDLGMPSLDAAVELMRIVAVTMTIVVVVISVVFLFFVFAMRNGRSWARILLTVVGSLNLLASLGYLGQLGVQFGIGGVGVVVATVNILILPVTALGIIAMYLPESNRYFQYN
ncbi:hypothetical protein UA75_02360 [Actinoalloteichus sp. GBA129-24]|uniref:Uncharacterized protein n=2 Tax=Pseudonocardiaceae TaxID=2070 RepID=A0AAC9L718_9PSEU|nr:hypothetical protein UA74_02355 [Actinoalloteichus fjordicus]APU18511.1 hypothetical protein UA75_02360 [Actinoalloteichus sp. GBA129-24]